MAHLEILHFFVRTFFLTITILVLDFNQLAPAGDQNHHSFYKTLIEFTGAFFFVKKQQHMEKQSEPFNKDREPSITTGEFLSVTSLCFKLDKQSRQQDL